MNTVLGNVSLRNNGTEPSEGRKAVQVQIDLSSGVGELDLVQVQQLGQIKSAQTIYVDNADNAFPITMQMVGTRQRMIVPANSQGYFNPVLPNPPLISFTSNPCLLNIQVMNFLIDPQVWSVSGGGNVGTVTSVGLSAPAEFSVSGSPVTTAGTLGFDWNNEAAHLILSGPSSGPNAKPTFRALVAADIPALPYGVGTVTSVGLAAPGIFTVSGSPVNAAGTLTLALANQAPNQVWAGPVGGGAAAPTFRALVAADIPALPYGTGTVTSVGLALPNIFTISGSPVNAAGTLTGTLANQGANTVWAGPTAGGAVAPSFRALVAADIPSLSGIYLPLAGGTMTGPLVMNATTITPAQTQGIVGTTTNNDAQAGSVGEYLENIGATVPLTAGPDFTVAQLIIPAGDWEIWGSITFNGNAATQVRYTIVSISEVNNSVDTSIGQDARQFLNNSLPFAVLSLTQPATLCRKKFSIATNVYLVAEAGFSVSTMSATGKIMARRRR